METTTDFYNALQVAANYIKRKLGIDRIDAAVVFGSGHKTIADHFENT